MNLIFNCKIQKIGSRESFVKVERESASEILLEEISLHEGGNPHFKIISYPLQSGESVMSKILMSNRKYGFMSTEFE